MKSLKANSEQTKAAPSIARGDGRIAARPADCGSIMEHQSARSCPHPAGLWTRAGEAAAGEPLPTSRWCLDDYAVSESVVASQHQHPNPAGSIHCQPLPTSRWGFDE
jgi:hypothetical protein